VLGWAVPLAAQPPAERELAIGLLVPSVPFAGPSERLAFAGALADHLARALGRAVRGRVFASRSDLQRAVQRAEIQLALVEAPYAAATRLGGELLAVAQRGGRSESRWVLVARRRLVGLGDLRGRTLALIRSGARDDDLLYHLLLAGEVSTGYFGAVLSAPDSASALVMVKVGRAEAALVPAEMTLPPGVEASFEVAELSWPVLLALPALPSGLRAPIAAAVRTFRSEQTALHGFAAAPPDWLGDVLRRLARPQRRAPMWLPPLPARDLLRLLPELDEPAIAALPVLEFYEAPAAP
jgi:hypothetical protein